MKSNGMLMGCACAALMIAATSAAAQRGVEGCWVGKVGSGTQIARVVLQLQKAGTASTVHIMSRTMSTDTLRDLVVQRDSVAFAFGTGERETAVGARRGSDGALAGGFSRAGAIHPLHLERAGTKPDPATALMGYWTGALSSGGAKVLTSALRFAPAPCGQVYVTLDSPDQGANDLPLTAISMVGDSLRFEMEYLDGAFQGTVSADRQHITGTWTQSGNVLELELTREAGG